MSWQRTVAVKSLKRENSSRPIDWCGSNGAIEPGATWVMDRSIACFKSSERRKKQNVCGRVTVERTRTTAEKIVPSNMCSVVGRKRLERRPPGASVHTCLGTLAGRETGPRCRPRDMRCDIWPFPTCDTHGSTRTVMGKQLRWTTSHRTTDQARARSSCSPSLSVALPLFALTDYCGGRLPPPDLGFASRSSVPAIL